MLTSCAWTWWSISCCAGRAGFPVVVQRHIPMVRLRLTTEISQLLHKVIDVPVCLSCRSFTSLSRPRGGLCSSTSLSWCRGGFPWSRLFGGPLQLQLIGKLIDVCCAGRASYSCAVVEVTAATASCGTRLGGDPRHQGGEGVAGTPGACSQAFCHPN